MVSVRSVDNYGHRLWSTPPAAVCLRPGNIQVVSLVAALTGVHERIAQDWFRGMETVGRRARSRQPTPAQVGEFIDRLTRHVRAEGVPAEVANPLLDGLRAFTRRQYPTGPEFLAWTTLREKIDKYRYDRFTATATHIQPGDLVTAPGHPGEHEVTRIHTTPRGRVVLTDTGKLTYSIPGTTLVRIARPDPTFGAPTLQIRDRHGGILRGLYGCGFATAPGTCGGRCRRPACDMDTALAARASRGPR